MGTSTIRIVLVLAAVLPAVRSLAETLAGPSGNDSPRREARADEGPIQIEPPAQLLNVRFGGVGSKPKVGFAAVGMSTNDFWNAYRRDGEFGEWHKYQVLPRLRWANGSGTHAGVIVENAPGHWGNGHQDPMMDEYLYSFDGRSVTLTFTNLSPGIYAVYAYGHGGPPDEQNARFEVSSGGKLVGSGRTSPSAGWLGPWREGVQYVAVTNVPVRTGDSLVVVSSPDGCPTAMINGVQLVRTSPTPRGDGTSTKLGAKGSRPIEGKAEPKAAPPSP
jgi:hypothetical protein